jgi:hypothetical protein
MEKIDRRKIRRANYIGKSFGRLTVVDYAGVYENPSKTFKTHFWLCECSCGNLKVINSSNLNNHHAKSCGCLNKELSSSRLKGNNLSYRNIKGTKNIRLSYYNRFKKNCSKNDREFLITIDYMQKLLEDQNYKCALTGVDIEMKLENPFNSQKNKKLNTASLDRIDSSKGYIEGNVQWVHKEINRLKSNFSEEDLIYWCKKIIENNEKNTNISLH